MLRLIVTMVVVCLPCYLIFSGATFSIQETQITTTEGFSGEICIVLENIGNGLERNISVTLNTTSGTAGTHMYCL